MNIRRRYLQTTSDVEREARKIGCDPSGTAIMKTKGVFFALRAEQIGIKTAIILKQEMMAIGGEVIVSKEVMSLKPQKTDALILGTQKQYKKLWTKMLQQPFGGKELAQKIQQAITKENRKLQKTTMQAKDKTLSFAKPIMMGVVNITPDSFYDGGKFLDVQKALAQCKELIEYGATILDLGAESSRPGSDPVSIEEEKARLLPVLDALMQDAQIKEENVLISIDTYKPEVAKECLEKGAHIINDISGLQNPAMRKTIAQHDAIAIMMHMQGTPKMMQQDPVYDDVMDDIISFFEQQLKLCEEEGVTKVICDPGIGFGKTLEHNLAILNRLSEIKILGIPILIGTSRKSFIGKAIGGTADDRLEGTIASNVVALQNGAHIFRVHDVKECKRALDLTHLIIQTK